MATIDDVLYHDCTAFPKNIEHTTLRSYIRQPRYFIMRSKLTEVDNFYLFARSPGDRWCSTTRVSISILPVDDGGRGKE